MEDVGKSFEEMSEGLVKIASEKAKKNPNSNGDVPTKMDGVMAAVSMVPKKIKVLAFFVSVLTIYGTVYLVGDIFSLIKYIF
jgi:hypothetical protein